jgi:hypothetical protein
LPEAAQHLHDFRGVLHGCCVSLSQM